MRREVKITIEALMDDDIGIDVDPREAGNVYVQGSLEHVLWEKLNAGETLIKIEWGGQPDWSDTRRFPRVADVRVKD